MKTLAAIFFMCCGQFAHGEEAVMKPLHLKIKDAIASSTPIPFEAKDELRRVNFRDRKSKLGLFEVPPIRLKISKTIWRNAQENSREITLDETKKIYRKYTAACERAGYTPILELSISKHSDDKLLRDVLEALCPTGEITVWICYIEAAPKQIDSYLRHKPVPPKHQLIPAQQAGTGQPAAQERDGSFDATKAFYEALKDIERDYIDRMRELASNAHSLKIYSISGTDSSPSLFDSPPKGESITQKGSSYTVHKEAALITTRKEIQAWAEAVLPKQSYPFAVCIPKPGFEIRFLDAEGDTIYVTTICMKCQSAAMEFPRYSDRIGFDLKTMEHLLEAAGFKIAEIKKAEQAGTGQPTTASGSESLSEVKPQPELEDRPQ